MDNMDMFDPTSILEIAVVGIGGYMVGNYASAEARAQKKSKKLWEGEAGLWKRKFNEMLQEQKSNDPMEQILGGLPEPIRSLASKYLSDPRLIESLIQKFLTPAAKSEKEMTMFGA
jgi:hypothetical protein